MKILLYAVCCARYDTPYTNKVLNGVSFVSFQPHVCLPCIILCSTVRVQAEVPAGWTWSAPAWTFVGGDCPRDKDGWTYGTDSSFSALLVDRTSGVRHVD